MKSTAIVCAIAAACLGFGSLAHAQSYDRNGSGDETRRYEQRERRDGDGWRNQESRRDWDGRRNWDGRRDEQAQRSDDRRHDWQAQRWDGRRDRDERRDWNHRRDNHREVRIHHHYNARFPQYQRGHYIPYYYRAPRYVVNDWYSYRLSSPPYGHHWVQVGPDFALIAIATGLIAHWALMQ
jgi:Ni/Co efflux regulator RcnB